jgi:Fe-S-cluster containining protein
MRMGLGIIKERQVMDTSECRGCGACCTNSDDWKWIEVTEEDAKLIPEYLLQEGDIEKYAMSQYWAGECICLKNNGECSIYEQRPTICRKVQRGDDVCMAALAQIFRLT